MSSTGGVDAEAVLQVFEHREDPAEPLATSEVADAVGVARRTAYDKLRALADEGHLASKRIGAQARAWWRPARRTADDTLSVQGSAGAGDDGLPVELTADEVLELEFASERLARPFLELGDPEMRLRIEGFVRLPDGSHVQYWTVEGVSGETVLDLPSNFPTNEDVRLLQADDDTYRVEVRGRESSLVSTYDDFDGESQWAVLEDGAIRNAVRFPASVDVEAVLAAIRDAVASDFELVSQKLVYSPRLFKALVEDELTDRQWTALRMAYYAGYFEVPRQSEGAEIADRMGITRQTLSHHLRHAIETVLGHLFEAPDGDGGVADSN